jgi:hypothetical protein
MPLFMWTLSSCVFWAVTDRTYTHKLIIPYDIIEMAHPHNPYAKMNKPLFSETSQESMKQGFVYSHSFK